MDKGLGGMISDDYVHIHRGGYRPPVGEDDDMVRVLRYLFPMGEDTEEVDREWCRWKKEE